MTDTRLLPSYPATLSQLWKLSAPGIRRNLEPVRLFLRQSGFPEMKRGRPFSSILVAGTNGKGSTAAMLSRILFQCGYRVGFYSSPHLIHYRERIQIQAPGAGSFFPETSWRRNFAKIAARLNAAEASLTQFEILTVLALLIFQEEKVDIAVLEVGVGGRWDATNVVEPVLSVITSVDVDHQDLLGDTRAEIAAEKAGIFRNHGCANLVAQPPEIMKIFLETAERKQVNLQITEPGILKTISLEEQTFEYKKKIFRQSLLGAHQVENACLAVDSARHLRDLGFSIPEEAIAEGIRKTIWPGRLQVVSTNPVVILDVAHNPHGARALADALTKLPLNFPKILILGILETKDARGILEALSPFGDLWILCKSSHPKGIFPGKLFPPAKAAAPEKEIRLAATVGEACRLALDLAGEGGTICATGSFTTAGEAGRIFQFLENRSRHANVVLRK